MKLLRGNPGRRPLNENEPTPAPAASLEAPEWLSPDARKEWQEKAPLLERLGLLTEADLDAFTIYCQAFARWKDAEKKLLQFGLVYVAKNSGYPAVSPYLVIANKAQAQCLKFLTEFGLTPSARSRVTAKPKSPANTNKERFFGRRHGS